MLVGSNCDCLVCRTEKHLMAELGEVCAWPGSELVRDSGSTLGGFQTPLDLVRALHAPGDPTDTSCSDRLLVELVRQNARAPVSSIWQRLLLVVFVPTIHRTTSQITASFPSLARDDASQLVVSVFLEFLRSAELAARRSHVAFTIARKLRRSAFRWAIREARLAPPENKDPVAAEDGSEAEPLAAEVLLNRFLDHCARQGWLSREERHLLVEFKLKGVSCRELASRNGHSAVAIQHRIQRLVDRLRRIAEKTPPRQMELFPR